MDIKLTPKEKFNAYSNADHIFSFKENDEAIQLLAFDKFDDNAKAVVVNQAGEVKGLFTDSVSAISSLEEVKSVFGDDQPFFKVRMKETQKGASVYYVEII